MASSTLWNTNGVRRETDTFGLSILLAQSQNLHRLRPRWSNRQALSSSEPLPFSLRQLVPIYATWIAALTQEEPQHPANDTATMDSCSRWTWTDTVTYYCPDPDEATLCLATVAEADGNDDADDVKVVGGQDHQAHTVLLTLQYLLFRCASQKYTHDGVEADPLVGMATVVLPFLRQQYQQLSAAKCISESLLEAILDAVFWNQQPVEEWHTEWLQTCLSLICVPNPVTAREKSSGVDEMHDNSTLRDQTFLTRVHWWKISSLLLVRLATEATTTDAAATTASEMIAIAVTDTMERGIREAAASSLEDIALLLRPLSNDLWPVLSTLSSSWQSTRYIERLWMVVGDLYLTTTATPTTTTEPIPSARLGPVLLTCTTILCDLFSSIIDKELPVFAERHHSFTYKTCCRPIAQSGFWQLIHYCLDQGNVVPKKLSWAWSEYAYQGLDTITSQLLRRRALYLLRCMVELEDLPTWNQFVACFEMIEMEFETHLIDQVWDTVASLCAKMETHPVATLRNESGETPPNVSWEWMRVLLARTLTSHDAPALRKLGLYRLFQGQAGIQVHSATSEYKCAADASVATDQNGNRLKNRQKKSSNVIENPRCGAPLSIVSTNFVWQVILPAYDSLEASVGLHMNVDVKGKIVSQDMSVLLENFLDRFIMAIGPHPERLHDFVSGLWKVETMGTLHRKTTVLTFSVLAKTLQNHNSFVLPLDEKMLQSGVNSFQMLYSLGSLVAAYRESLLNSLATVLASATPVATIPPLSILSVLALYPLPTTTGGPGIMSTESIEKGVTCLTSITPYSALYRWLTNLSQETSLWGSTLGSALSMAYVSGSLFKEATPTSFEDWDPVVGSSQLDRELGKAIALFSSLALNTPANDSSAAGEVLWPAIHKGLESAAAASSLPTWPKAERVTRALILLESGCQLRVLSGIGNGDLLMDRKTQQMMPPSPSVERMLRNAITFLSRHVQVLSAKDSGNDAWGSVGGSRSGNAKRLSATFARLIGQFQVLHEGFPSSMMISEAVGQLLNKSLKTLVDSSDGASSIHDLALLFASLTSGAELEKYDLLSTAQLLLSLRFADLVKSGSHVQPARSVFQYAKWGSLSIILPSLFDNPPESTDNLVTYQLAVFEKILDELESTPHEALMPLFKVLLITVKSRFSSLSMDCNPHADVDNLRHLDRISKTLISMMIDSKTSSENSYMLDEICKFLFSVDFLMDEADRLRKDSAAFDPIRSAFRRLINIAGTARTHIARSVLCRICASWLGPEKGNSKDAGIAAIPYMEDISKLLVHKEELVAIASRHQDITSIHGGATLQVPANTDESSIVRGLILTFVAMLPNVDRGLKPDVLSKLLHPLILSLFDKALKTSPTLVMKGTAAYCIKMRAWQALCILSRFVTSDIAEEICTKLFRALAENLHGQIRYFLEIFTIQCSRKFPELFSEAIVSDIRRTDLSLQQVSSLMVVTGNLIVGRYQNDFNSQLGSKKGKSRLKQILAGVIPWLSSTQGFSRAIAQLLVHRLIPLVMDLSDAPIEKGELDKDWYLRSLHNFLETNTDMSRLRKKQTIFFSGYNVDEVCTPEGALSIRVDEGHEADPDSMIDLIKDCLQEVYVEAHAKDVPTWKQIQNIIDMGIDNEESTDSLVDGDVNFQRKIIPLDALNLAMEELREQRLRNIAGRRKQGLVVCASLIDKVPNLGGLARTAEIFAADRLVIPDLQVTKMDNFKSLCVGASDWIEIEECNEKDLANWLRCARNLGYYIVGIEQTSSSVSLCEFQYPDAPTVLLLGKEKEGIPVEYLQLVDQCVEIPQLGIIRSLNVHVSGAISMWEYTRQKLLAGRLKI